jgi:hypothetical protein
MLHDKRVQQLGLCILLLSGLAACSSSNNGDASTAGDAGASGEDAAPATDSGTGSADAAPRDVGPRSDGGMEITDASYYCAVNNEVQVGQTQVAITPATDPATTMGSASNTACIDQPPTMGAFTAPIFIRGCINVLAPSGTMTTQSDIDVLDVAVFFAKDPNTGDPVDPSWDRATGMDKTSNARIPVHFTVDTNIAMSTCASRLQLTIGFQPGLTNSLQSETEYIVRTRTATTAGMMQNVWAPTYYYDIIVRNNKVTGRTDLSTCTPNVCFLRHNFNLIRTAGLRAFANAVQTPGGDNFADGMGAGYALLEAYDCGDLPMKNAVAGVSPSALGKGYLDATGMLDTSAMASSDLGLFMALGFMGQDASSTAPIETTAAFGIKRDAMCTEEFGGRKLEVFPDSVSILRSSQEIVLHTHP